MTETEKNMMLSAEPTKNYQGTTTTKKEARELLDCRLI